MLIVPLQEREEVDVVLHFVKYGEFQIKAKQAAFGRTLLGSARTGPLGLDGVEDVHVTEPSREAELSTNGLPK
jgi:hypothetical protein